MSVPRVPAALRPALEVAYLVGVVSLVAWVLFGPPVVGVADNGDYHRMLAWFGLEHSLPPADSVAAYADLSYLRAADSAPLGLGFPSSELAFLTVARLCSALTGGPALDLRMSGLAHLAGFAGALWWLLIATRPLAARTRAVLLVLIGLLLADVAYVSYFNSVFSEPASLVFLVLTAAAGLSWANRGAQDVRGGLVFVACGLLLVTSKPQHLLTGCALLAFVVVASGPRHRPILALTGSTLVLLPLAVYLVLPLSLRQANLYSAVYQGILLSAPSPAEGAQALGLPPSAAQLAGTSPWRPGTGFLEPKDADRRRSLLEPVSQARLTRVWLTHPQWLARALWRGAADARILRDPALGNFAPQAGLPPGTHSERYAWWSSLRTGLPQPALVLTTALALIAGVATVLAWRNRRSPTARTRWLLLLLGPVVITGQLLTVALGDPLEAQRKLVTANAAFDMSLAALAATAVSLRPRRPSPPGPGASQPAGAQASAVDRG